MSKQVGVSVAEHEEDGICEAKPKKKKCKKVKNNKRSWHSCPFCGKEMLQKEEWVGGYFDRYAKAPVGAQLCECGAIKVECPCCKEDTLMKDGFVKHWRKFGCSYNGHYAKKSEVVKK